MHITDEVLEALAVFANGDARTALSTLEMVVLNGEVGADGSVTVTEQTFEQCTSKKSLLYDKKGEEHYNLISALHKSMRNSDPDAAVYWLARMLEAGEDPLYVSPPCDPLCQRRCRPGRPPARWSRPSPPTRHAIFSACRSARSI